MLISSFRNLITLFRPGWWAWPVVPRRRSSSFLLLFQQSLVLCSAQPGAGAHTDRPHLTFSCSLRWVADQKYI